MIIGNYTKTKQIIIIAISILVCVMAICLFNTNNHPIVSIMLSLWIIIILFLNYFYSKMYNIRLEKNHITIENLFKKREMPYSEFVAFETTERISVFPIFSILYIIYPSRFYLKLNNGQRIYFERNPKRYFDLIFPFSSKKVALEIENKINEAIRSI